MAPRLLLVLCSLLALAHAGRAAEPFAAVQRERPVLKLEQYFAGRTHSWGIFETRSGAPREILHTQTTGRWRNGVLKFEQDLQFQSGKKMHRSWLIRRVDAHHYTATGTGIVGTAHATAYGNAVHLEFTLDAVPGQPLAHLHMSQWLYLMPDGVTLLNRDTLTKGGLLVTQLIEYFHKDR
jgi:hypothetical protein